MPNQRLYTGALKTVRTGDTAVPKKTSRPCPEATERLFKIGEPFKAAARAWLESGTQVPTQLRTAAAVVFVRDGQEGLETILTYRPDFSPLGTVAFPGGVCNDSDREQMPWSGPGAKAWAEAFKQDDLVAAHAAVVCAIRESFEETGMLLAGSDDLSTVEVSAEGYDQMALRESVACGDKAFVDLLTRRGLTLRTDLLRALGRWQSPDYRHKRYDIHYFASAIPIGQSPKLLSSKGVWGDWVNVKQLLDRQDTTEFGDRIGREETVGRTLKELITPGTLCLLESLAGASTAIAFLAQKRTVQVKKAEIIERDGEYFLRYTVPKKAGTWEKCSL